jgi:hypothetical protein
LGRLRNLQMTDGCGDQRANVVWTKHQWKKLIIVKCGSRSYRLQVVCMLGDITSDFHIHLVDC